MVLRSDNDLAVTSHPTMLHASRNARGRDFVVGDIHGEFDKLEAALTDIDFDPATDRLFSVGDLIDRGPASARALEWLEQPYFYAVRGNHETLALEAVDDPDALANWVMVNGGQWWLELSRDEQARFVQAFTQMPFAIEVESDDGLVGIVHADVPAGYSWTEFTTALGEDAEVRHIAVWSRERALGSVRGPVSGVDWVYCGHTPHDRVRLVDNVLFLDTGACFGGYLSVLPIPPT